MDIKRLIIGLLTFALFYIYMMVTDYETVIILISSIVVVNQWYNEEDK